MREELLRIYEALEVAVSISFRNEHALAAMRRALAELLPASEDSPGFETLYSRHSEALAASRHSEPQLAALSQLHQRVQSLRKK